jgi:hypothetical protein
MNYIDDVQTLLTPLISVPIYLENWADKVKVVNQVCIMSEPSTVDVNSPVMTVNFGIYVRHKKIIEARNIANIIFAKLTNYKGKMDPVSTNVFQFITCLTPPYYYSGEANFPIYLVRFKALVIEQSINTTQKYL